MPDKEDPGQQDRRRAQNHQRRKTHPRMARSREKPHGFDLSEAAPFGTGSRYGHRHEVIVGLREQIANHQQRPFPCYGFDLAHEEAPQAVFQLRGYAGMRLR